MNGETVKATATIKPKSGAEQQQDAADLMHESAKAAQTPAEQAASEALSQVAAAAALTAEPVTDAAPATVTIDAKQFASIIAAVSTGRPLVVRQVPESTTAAERIMDVTLGSVADGAHRIADGLRDVVGGVIDIVTLGRTNKK